MTGIDSVQGGRPGWKRTKSSLCRFRVQGSKDSWEFMWCSSPSSCQFTHRDLPTPFPYFPMVVPRDSSYYLSQVIPLLLNFRCISSHHATAHSELIQTTCLLLMLSMPEAHEHDLHRVALPTVLAKLLSTFRMIFSTLLIL